VRRRGHRSVHALQGSTLDLSDARTTGIQADPATCSADDAAGRAIVFGTPPRSAVTVERSVVAGGWTIPSFQAGLWIDDGAIANVHDNRITDVVCGRPGCGPDPIFGGQGIGVLLLLPGPETRVVDIEIDGNEVGITQVASPSCCLIAHNTLTDNRFFGVIQDGDGATNGNLITGGQVGIGLVADAVDTFALLRGDRISATTDAAVREIECSVTVPPRW
jgi:hypothetical protein